MDETLLKDHPLLTVDAFIPPEMAIKAEEVLMGKEINEANAEAAASAFISPAKPLPNNGYMVQIAKVMVKRAILACK